MGSGDTRLVGRTRELRAIDSALAGVLDGRSSWIALVGEPGIGKTRLMQEACRRAEQASVAIVEGRGTEFEREIPFGLVADALERPLARRDRAWLERLGEGRLAELAAVLPSLAMDGGDGLKNALPAERYRCYDAVRAVIEQLAAERPLLIALDDLHWADDASLELVAHLIRRQPAQAVAAVVAYRTRQAPRRLLEAAARAERDAGLRAFELGPLSEDEARELLSAGGDRTNLGTLYRESGGNPFYLTELARATPATNGARTGLAVEEDVPAAVQAAIAREMDEATPAAATLLRAAAVAGETFGLDLIAEIAEITEREALTLLDELLELQFVRPSETPRHFAFRHPIVRRAVYVSSGSGFRLVAHARAAAALQRSGATLSAIAHHVERSARPGDAQAAELLASAAQASEARAPAAAARWYEGALRLLPDGAPREQRFALLTARGLALGAIGKVEESSAALTAALPLLGSDEIVSRARLVGALSRLEHMVGEHGRAHRLLLDSLAHLGDSDPVASAALQVELAMDCWWGNDSSGMAAFALAARDAARDHGEPVLHGFATALLALANCYRGGTSEAAASADLAAGLIDQLPDSELASRVEAFAALGYAEHALERFDESARHLQRGIAICRSTGQSLWFALLITALGSVHAWQGRLREAWEAAEAATASARLQHPLPQLHALNLRCWIQILRGDLHAAIATGREALAIAEDAPALMNWRIQSTLALAEIESGEPARGRDRILAQMGGGELTAVRAAWRPRWYETLSIAELALGDVNAAARWADRAADAAASQGLRGRHGEAKRARAAVELARGNAHSGAELAREASESFSAVGRRIDTGRAWILEAQAHAELGSGDLAVDLLQRAHSELKECGARRYLAAAARELRRLGRPAAPSGGRETVDDDGPLAALSRREREVADLVARGMRNREIAEELVLSQKTVESHLAHIFEKLGVSSRVQVVRLVQGARRDPGAHD